MKRRTFLKGVIAGLSASGLPVQARLTGSDWRGNAEQGLNYIASDLELFVPQPLVCKVVSIGGAGSRIVNSQMGRLLDAHQVIAIDTNVHGLRNAMANEKILLSNDADTAFTYGNPVIAEALAWKAHQRIESVLAGADMVFIVAGMGGGTGSGVASVIARLAKQTLSDGSVVIAVATTPLPDEGALKAAVATQGLGDLHRFADSVIEIPNGRLFDRTWQASPRWQIPAYHGYPSRVLGEAYAVLAGSVLRSSNIAVDFEDVRTVLAGGSMASVGWGESDSWEPNAVRLAARAALNHPLLGKNRIAHASGLLVSISTGTASNDDVSDVLSEIRQKVTGTARIVVSTDEFDVRMEGIDVRIIAVQ
jgi:cell division protein FtsZ